MAKRPPPPGVIPGWARADCGPPLLQILGLSEELSPRICFLPRQGGEARADGSPHRNEARGSRTLSPSAGDADQSAAVGPNRHLYPRIRTQIAKPTQSPAKISVSAYPRPLQRAYTSPHPARTDGSRRRTMAGRTGRREGIVPLPGSRRFAMASAMTAAVVQKTCRPEACCVSLSNPSRRTRLGASVHPHNRRLMTDGGLRSPSAPAPRART